MITLQRRDHSALVRARALIAGYESVLVAFSGGVDSTLLLRLCLDELGPDRVVACLASSPAYPDAEQDQARALAKSLAVRLVEVDTEEVELEAYRRNLQDRCFHCKQELFAVLEPVRRELGLARLAYGATADDAGDHRPGHAAAEKAGVEFPLLEAGMGKAEIRLAARDLGLPNWDKPSFACLSSRIPHGVEISPEMLQQIGRAEKALTDLGFGQVRVRHHGDVARIEVEAEDMQRLLAERAAVVAGVRDAGYKFVALDLEGYSTGALHRTWRPTRP